MEDEEATNLDGKETRDLLLLGDGAHRHIVDLHLGVMSTPTFHVAVADTGLMVEADHLLAPHLDRRLLGEGETLARPDRHHTHGLDHRQSGDEML